MVAAPFSSRAVIAATQATLAQLEVAAPVVGVIVTMAARGDHVETGARPAIFSIAPAGDAADSGGSAR